MTRPLSPHTRPPGRTPFEGRCSPLLFPFWCVMALPPLESPSHSGTLVHTWTFASVRSEEVCGGHKLATLPADGARSAWLKLLSAQLLHEAAFFGRICSVERAAPLAAMNSPHSLASLRAAAPPPASISPHSHVQLWRACRQKGQCRHTRGAIGRDGTSISATLARCGVHPNECGECTFGVSALAASSSERVRQARGHTRQTRAPRNPKKARGAVD